jgi:hypothetical protein
MCSLQRRRRTPPHPTPPPRPPTQLADEAVCIGEAPSSESYLSIPSIISAAISRNADAIHPVSPPPFRQPPGPRSPPPGQGGPTQEVPQKRGCGPERRQAVLFWTQRLCMPVSAPLPLTRRSRPPPPPFCAQGYGFLSENSTFVDICADHGLEFIGPRSDSIRIMGDKSTARDTMKARPRTHPPPAPPRPCPGHPPCAAVLWREQWWGVRRPLHRPAASLARLTCPCPLPAPMCRTRVCRPCPAPTA